MTNIDEIIEFLSSINKKILAYVRDGNFNLLYLGPLLIGIVLFFLSVWVSTRFLQDRFAMAIQGICGGLSAFIMGLNGVVVIIRRELPGSILRDTYKGWRAVLSGLLWIIFTWGIGLSLFYIGIIGE